MSGDAASLKLLVQDRDDQDRWTTIGQVTYGDRGVLALVETEPIYKDYVTELVETINGLERLKIKVPPPPGVEPGAVCTQVFTREFPRLLQVIGDYAEQNFGLRLAPPEGEITYDPLPLSPVSG